MTRNLKPQQVGTIESKILGDVPLFLNRNSLKFNATVGAANLEAESYQALESLVHTKIREFEDVDWTPVIRVKTGKQYTGSGHAQTASVALDLERFYVAVAPSGLLKSRWDGGGERGMGDRYGATETARRLHGSETFYWRAEKDGPFVLPAFRNHDYHAPTHAPKDDAFYAYTDILWSALTALAARINALRDELGAFLMNPATVPALYAELPLLLPEHGTKWDA